MKWSIESMWNQIWISNAINHLWNEALKVCGIMYEKNEINHLRNKVLKIWIGNVINHMWNEVLRVWILVISLWKLCPPILGSVWAAPLSTWETSFHQIKCGKNILALQTICQLFDTKTLHKPKCFKTRINTLVNKPVLSSYCHSHFVLYYR